MERKIKRDVLEDKTMTYEPKTLLPNGEYECEVVEAAATNGTFPPYPAYRCEPCQSRETARSPTDSWVEQAFWEIGSLVLFGTIGYFIWRFGLFAFDWLERHLLR